MCNPIINRRLLWCFLENSGCSSAASFTFKYAEKDLRGCSAFKDGRVYPSIVTRNEPHTVEPNDTSLNGGLPLLERTPA